MEAPHGVRNRLLYPLELIRVFNEEVLRCREIEKQFGQPGRYEFEYCQKAEARVSEALETISEFERLAIAEGMNPREAYEEMGLYPDPEPWSDAALVAWPRLKRWIQLFQFDPRLFSREAPVRFHRVLIALTLPGRDFAF
jgi:hypothetical protein